MDPVGPTVGGEIRIDLVGCGQRRHRSHNGRWMRVVPNSAMSSTIRYIPSHIILHIPEKRTEPFSHRQMGPGFETAAAIPRGAGADPIRAAVLFAQCRTCCRFAPSWR